ncbi:chromosome segregation protein SMC [Shewanella intestini]|uniref:Chromosome partition protein Smc n=1 Tax=Shewanella intestini TaxID=2017544 RepID=A0ABS5HYV1_9GAMM|nr:MULTISPECIES: chromosome segregation protein SMC [Shewanella]MBR9726968.1 chromosome segregation protein SMC [Shewanella intestini]MRG34466.1 chromosome segregation protein SMC [Shewanella sp. XMDDZSB0408]
MRLKQIKLAGFKSFVDPTKIPFEHALSAVVGPNGCGKSNVIDAVRWVLGESSAKNLRGDAMTDVIFNGSSSRKPISVASVELTFENTQGRLAGQYASFQDIAVKRQVNRDSESSYFLNGQKCRRKDITDLFMGTGLGPRSYAIIEQGTISRLIESKPQELRVFIEEAAGISRYKERRRETENRIRHTRENLQRLNDIRSELGIQLEKLANQAADARAYRKLKASEREHQAQLLVLKLRELDKQADKLTVQITELEDKRTQSADELREFETSQTLVNAQLSELINAEQKQVEQFYQAGNNVTRLEQQIAHQQQLDSEQRQQHDSLQQQIVLNNKALIEQQQHHQQLCHQQEQLVLTINDLTDEIAICDEQALVIDQQNEQTLAVSRISHDKLSEVQTSFAVAQSSLAHVQQQQQLAETELAQISQDQRQQANTSTKVDLADVKLQMQTITTRLAKLDDTIKLQKNNKSACETKLKLTQQSFSQTKQQQASLQARGELIEQLLDKQQQHDGKQLWQILEVELGWEAAVDSLFTQLLAMPVDEQGNGNGFHLFANTSSLTTPDNREHEGASKVIAAANIAPWLTGVIWVEDDVAASRKLSQLKNHQFCVTKAGELIGHGFHITPSSAQPLMQLSQELNQVNQLLTEQQQHYQQQQLTVSQLTEQFSQLQLEIADLTQQHQSATQDYHALNAQAATLTQQLNAQEQRLADSQRKKAQINQSMVDNQQRLTELEQTLEQFECQKHALSQDYEQQVQHQQTAMGQLKHLKQQKQTHQQQLQQQQLQKQQLTTALALSEQQQQQQQEKLQQLQQQIAQLSDSTKQVNHDAREQHLQRLQQQLTEQLKKQSELEQSLLQVRQQQALLQKTLDSSLLKQKQQLGQQQGLTQSLGTLQLRREGIKGQIDAQRQLITDQDVDIDQVLAQMPQHAKINQWLKALEDIKKQLEQLGAINLAAIEEYDTQHQRKSYLDEQDLDLTQALGALEGAIKKIDRETRTRFKTTYDAVNADLQKLFPKVFGGGKAYLALTDDDLLDTGVTIMAQPPGKKNSTIHLLSGGEKALTALSLVFAIFRLNPAPFCMLDEVDAPLDDANVGRFCRLLEEMSQSVQFIYISHNKITMEMAEQLIGVTMHEPGVSRIVAVDIDTAVAMADAV